jgi:hypothetical protein
MGAGLLAFHKTGKASVAKMRQVTGKKNFPAFQSTVLLEPVQHKLRCMISIALAGIAIDSNNLHRTTHLFRKK